MELENKAKELENQALVLENQTKEVELHKTMLDYAIEKMEKLTNLDSKIDAMKSTELKQRLAEQLLQLVPTPKYISPCYYPILAQSKSKKMIMRLIIVHLIVKSRAER